MFLTPRSEALVGDQQLPSMLISASDYAGVQSDVTRPRLLGSSMWLCDMLLPANRRPLLSVGTPELRHPTYPIGSDLIKTDLRLFTGNGLICTSGWWPKLDSVNLYVNQVEQQLIGFQSDLSKLHVYQNYVSGPDYYSDSWTDEFEDLYARAVELGVANSRLRRARWMATANPTQAYRFLAGEVRAALTEQIAHLRRRLRIAKALRSKLLRLFASVYEFRNQIVLQRRYYLAHGSHPIENSAFHAARWSLGQRGCVPAFLQ